MLNKYPEGGGTYGISPAIHRQGPHKHNNDFQVSRSFAWLGRTRATRLVAVGPIATIAATPAVCAQKKNDDFKF